MNKLSLSILVSLLLPGCAETAIHADGIPDYNGIGASRFEANGDVVYDKATDLYWKRCFEGERWDGTNCVEFADIDSWHGAKSRETNSGGWRLPTKDELLGISSTYSLPVWGSKSRPSHMIWSNDDAAATYFGVVLRRKWMVSNKNNYAKQGRIDADFDSALIRLVCDGKICKSKDPYRATEKKQPAPRRAHSKNKFF